ncbi:hypothetical protein OS493_028009 [Desmophyllum pertusum]|uniref:Uncharacterized protein n=1 Tax=Desmophyllum pertusum TaxID=174260 RepID=A0A9W9ZZC7_9CNID|nr:hypothetical protein OS493_028009 [Desmophyllum pertusum]
MANGDQELQKVKDAVCLIVGETRDERGNLVSFKGTGFYTGLGWIMTVAHNFQDDIEQNKTDKTTHSILSDARFRVEFDIEGQKYVFQERKRMAFIHHLEPGEDADPQNKDIAMVKLGHQWDYGRIDYTKWEKEEQEKLGTMGAHDFALANIDVPKPEKDETVYAVHYGGNDDSKKSEESKILPPPSPPWYQRCCFCRRLPSKVPMLHLEKKIGVLPAGASGCPIMVKRGVNYRLVGLHFSGDDDDEDGEAQALQWSRGIHDYIKMGVRIIADIGSYMAYSKLASQLEGSPELQETASKTAQNPLANLESEAKGAKLTIYLCNGEVINQQ